LLTAEDIVIHQVKNLAGWYVVAHCQNHGTYDVIDMDKRQKQIAISDHY
jgi:hypothetical protein